MEDTSNDSRLLQLLKELGVEAAFDYLKASQVTYNSLQYMQQTDIKEAIPPLGLRMEFREKLFKWKKLQFGIDDDTISVQSKVDNWLTEKEDFQEKQVLNQSLDRILRQSASGRSLLEYKNKHLTIDQRNALIHIIIEEAISKDIIIRSQEFPLLLKEIVSIFPLEKEVQDIYYIPRSNQRSPSGKLYCKYKNHRAKRLKLRGSFSQDENEEKKLAESAAEVEIDATIAAAIKVSLNRDSADWDDVCAKWRQTYYIRRQDLLELDNLKFLQSWSKLSHAKAADLVQIDFELLFPGKNFMLFSKWDTFKLKIVSYYKRTVTNEVCKQQLQKAKETKNIDSQDFILTILLSSIFQSSVRFKNSNGKKSKKITIADSQESFVLQLTTLNDCERKINEIICKYYTIGETLQPFIIVEGNEVDIQGFYVYFDKNLLKCDSFLESLDVCFKIFHVLCLKYPIACQQSWLFIQKFFFQIETDFDIKSASVSSVINYLNNN